MAELGNGRRVYIVTESTSSDSYDWLTGEQTNSFNRTAEAIEYSDKSTVWAQFLSGKKGATAEVTVYVDDTDEQQQAVLSSLYQGEAVKVFIGTLGTSDEPSEGDVFSAIVTAISDTNDNGAVASRSLSLTATGEVTHYPSI